MNSNRYHERGATAIVIVIFSVLLLLTVTVGFMRLEVLIANYLEGPTIQLLPVSRTVNECFRLV